MEGVCTVLDGKQPLNFDNNKLLKGKELTPKELHAYLYEN